MSRSDGERFADIIDAIDRCQGYAPHLRSGRHIAVAQHRVMRHLDIVDNQLSPLKDERQHLWVT